MVQLKRHNEFVYAKIREALKYTKQIALVQATGTGKTFVMMKLLEDELGSNDRALIVVPTMILELNHRSNKEWDSKKTDFVTYCKLTKANKDTLKEILSKYKVIVLDEMHRAGADKWQIPIDFLLRESKNNIIIGMTATHIRYLDNKRNMVDELFNGNVVEGPKLEYAVKHGILPRFHYITAYFDIENRLNRIRHKANIGGENKFISESIEHLEIELNKYQLSNIINEYTMHMGNNQKWIVFCEDKIMMDKVEDNIQEWFRGHNGLTLYKMYHKNSIKNRADMLSKFKDKKLGINIILSVNILNEGQHIEGLDGIIMFRHTISPIIFKQQLGRVLSSGNTDKYPVVIDLVGNHATMGDFYNTIINMNKSTIGGKFERNGQAVIFRDYAIECEDLLHKIELQLNITRDNWEDWEDAIILKMKNADIKDINYELPHRSIPAIRTRRIKLGIADRNKKYSKEESDIIKKYYGKIEKSKLLEKLPGRTWASIQGHVSKLELREPLNDLTNEQIQEITTLWKNGVSAEKIAQKLNKHESTIRRKLHAEGFDLRIRMKFTAEEENFIKLNNGKLSIQELAQALNRTEKAIHSKIRKMYGNQKFTDDYINNKNIIEDTIAKNYPTGGYPACAKLLPCMSDKQIYKIVNRLGIKKENNFEKWTEEEDNIIRRIYPYKGADGCKELLAKRTIESIYRRAYLLKIKRQ